MTDAVVLARLATEFDHRGKPIARTLQKMWAKKTVIVTVLGDSVLATATVGNASGGVPGTNDVMSLVRTDLQTRFGCTITLNNRAVGGTTTQVESMNQWATALADRPDLLILGGGKNDIDRYAQAGNLRLQGSTTSGAMSTLERQIVEARQVLPDADLAIFVDNPYNAASGSNAYSTQWNAEARKLAAAYDVLLVDGYTSFTNLGTWDALLYDGTHPNVAGNRQLADEFLKHFPANWTPEVARRQGASLFRRTVPGVTRIQMPWLHSRLGMQTLSSLANTASRPRFVKTTGTWGGLTGPVTSSTAGDDITFTIPAADALLHLTCGAGQGVCTISVDGVPTWVNVDLTTFVNGKFFHINDMGQGWHFIDVKVVSGSVTVNKCVYEHQRAQWVDYTTLTAAGMGTASTGLSAFPGNGGALSAAAGTLTRTFVGTALDVALWRTGTGGTSYLTSITIDGTAITLPTLDSTWSGYTTKRVVSGLPFGKHTVVFTFAAGGLYVGGLIPIDERVSERPARLEGWAEAAEVVKFPQDWPATPILSSKDSTALTFSSVSVSGFTMGATAGWWVATAADESAENRLIY